MRALSARGARARVRPRARARAAVRAGGGGPRPARRARARANGTRPLVLRARGDARARGCARGDARARGCARAGMRALGRAWRRRAGPPPAGCWSGPAAAAAPPAPSRVSHRAPPRAAWHSRPSPWRLRRGGGAGPESAVRQSLHEGWLFANRSRSPRVSVLSALAASEPPRTWRRSSRARNPISPLYPSAIHLFGRFATPVGQNGSWSMQQHIPSTYGWAKHIATLWAKETVIVAEVATITNRS